MQGAGQQRRYIHERIITAKMAKEDGISALFCSAST
jgi:hypothetical protein